MFIFRTISYFRFKLFIIYTDNKWQHNKTCQFPTALVSYIKKNDITTKEVTL